MTNLKIKKRTKIKGQVCRFSGEMTSVGAMEVSLSVGISDRKMEAVEDASMFSGKIGLSGLAWGKQQIKNIQELGLAIIVTADFGCPKRLLAYSYLQKIGFVPGCCWFDDDGKISEAVKVLGSDFGKLLKSHSDHCAWIYDPSNRYDLMLFSDL